MPILLYIALAIVAIVLLIIALFYLAKGILALICWFLNFLPTMIKAAIYWIIVVLLYTTFQITSEFPLLPIAAYPLLYLVIMVLILGRRYLKHGFVFGSSGGEYKGYVLNKKSKVIHEKYSNSAETIRPHHRKELSSSEARELINNNEKYHFKN